MFVFVLLSGRGFFFRVGFFFPAGSERDEEEGSD